MPKVIELSTLATVKEKASAKASNQRKDKLL
jgi:hypothetical protein